eukprot:SAG11_NODE_3110_length_2680_cov_1.724138_2_plen_63_part_00
MVRMLLEAGADYTKPTKLGGSTAIELAAEKGHIEVARELLKWGAPVWQKSSCGVRSLPNCTV